MSNWYTATYLNSRFIRELIVAKAEPNGRYALLKNELALYGKDGRTERWTLRNTADLRAVPTDTFRITWPTDGKLETVLARFAKAPLRAAE